MTKWKGAPPSSRRRAGEESAPATTTTTAERDGSRRRALGQIRCGTIIQERFTAPKLQIRPSLSLRLECKLLVLVFCRTIYLTPNRTTGSNNSTTHKMIAESTRKRGRQILHLTYFILSFIQPYRAKGVHACMIPSLCMDEQYCCLVSEIKSIEQLIDAQVGVRDYFRIIAACKLQDVDRVRPFEDQEDQRAEKLVMRVRWCMALATRWFRRTCFLSS
jgi:hypothetical protein